MALKLGLVDGLQISYPSYFLIFIAVIAGAFAISLYFKDKRIKENKSWLPFILGWVRFTAIAGILFLLLVPIFKNFITETEKPLLVIARDASGSMDQIETDDANNIDEVLQNLKNANADKYDFLDFEFSDKLKLSENDSISSLSTNLSLPLEYVSEAYEDQNLAGIIMLTDGIYNEGKNPIYADASIPAPVHVIALGDTTIRKDLLIKNVLHNRIVYLNDKFIIETDIQAYNAAGSKTSAKLFIHSNGQKKLIEEKSININSNKYFESIQFELEATQVGNVKYSLELSGIANELSYANNSRSIYIEILDARQKILLLCNSPHPDIKAFQNIIKSNKNYEIDIAYASDKSINYRDKDLIILHNLPSRKHTITPIIDHVNTKKVPVVYIVGNDTDLDKFNLAQEVMIIVGDNLDVNNVTASLNNDFNIFINSDELKNKVESFVPLKSPFGEYQLMKGAKTLLYQRIGSVATDYPLLAYTDFGNHKQSVLTGEGIYRWWLTEYLDNKEQSVTSEIVSKTVQYVSQKEDKRQFRAFTNRTNYKENEEVLLDAQLYNENFELINTPDAFLVVTNESGEKFEYTYSKSNSYYFVNAGRFPEGNYSYTARTSYNGKDLVSSGKFTVQSILKEQFDLTAKHDILNQLVQKYNGELFYPNQLEQLASTITNDENSRPVLYQRASTRPLLELKWILGALLFLLGLEWFIRRYFGSY